MNISDTALIKASPAPPRSVSISCGTDMELGIFIIGRDTADNTCFEASRALLREIDGVASCSVYASSGNFNSVSYGTESGYGSRVGSEDSYSQDLGRKFLLNGGCAYIDLSHLELCTPEMLSAYDFVASVHAFFFLAHRACREANKKLPPGQRIQVLANNSDGQGNSYGSHLNFLITRKAWDHIFNRRLHYLLWLATYQASSIIFTGQGKVGAENGAAPVDYQIAQRADFYEALSGIQTTHHRPLVNSRDEALCAVGWGSKADDPGHSLARLHCIFYDNNLCQTANLLKVGVMQIILAMIEHERVDSKLLLADPMSAVIQWSHDPSLKQRAETISGQAFSALEIQWQFLEAARAFVEAGCCDDTVPQAREILALWADTLERFEAGDYATLARRVDWIRKWLLLQEAIRLNPRLTWKSPEIKYLDHLYSSLDPEEGLHWACDRGGLVDRVVSEEHIRRLLQFPPDNTRAWTRALLLLMAGPDEIDAVDWNYLRFRLPAAGRWSVPEYRMVRLSNPLGHTKAVIDLLLPQAGNLREALAVLSEPDPVRLLPGHLTQSSNSTPKTSTPNMELRERHHNPEPHSNRHAEPAIPDGNGLEALQQEATALFNEGSDIIKKALSGNSEAFLSSNRQSGGQ